MPSVTGRVAALGIGSGPKTEVNLHDVSGSHDLDRVRRAATMSIARVEPLPDGRVIVAVIVSNVGSGHCFPTGLPKHQAILNVRLTDRGRLVGERTIEFAKVLLNNEMMPLSREEDMFLEARSIRSDTRLRPRENRNIEITFSDVQAPEGVVEASLSYQYTARVLRQNDPEEHVDPTEMKILIATQQRAVPKR